MGYRGRRGIEVCHRRVGEHAHRHFHHLAELRRVSVKGTGEGKQLFKRQFLRGCCHDTGYFLRRDVCADIELYLVVAVSERRIDVCEKEGVLLRVTALYHGFAGVRLYGAVRREGYDGVFVVEVAGAQVFHQTFPVFGVPCGVHYSGGEVVQIVDIVHKAACASLGKALVAGVRAVGRCVSYYRQCCYGNILVGFYLVDWVAYLGKLAGVVAVVGVNDCVTYLEVDERRAWNGAGLYFLGFGLHIDDCGHEHARCKVESGEQGGAAVTYVVAAASLHRWAQYELWGLHPGGVFHHTGVLCGVSAVWAQKGICCRSRVVAQVAVVACASCHNDFGQHERVGFRFDYRGEYHLAVCLGGELRQVYL